MGKRIFVPLLEGLNPFDVDPIPIFISQHACDNFRLADLLFGCTHFRPDQAESISNTFGDVTCIRRVALYRATGGKRFFVWEGKNRRSLYVASIKEVLLIIRDLR